VQLKNSFRNIDADCGKLHSGSPTSSGTFQNFH
jgi:hypothetical protein